MSAPTEEQSRRYLLFIEDVPGDALQKEPLLSHSQAVLTTLNQQYSNLVYLQRILPAIPKIIQNGPKAQVGQMLNSLTANAASYPDPYTFLHEVMRENWPATDTALSPYNPATIFNGALSFVQSNPSHTGSGEVLLSMQSMVRARIVDAGSEAGLVTAAVSAWPYHPSEANQVLERSTSVATPEAIAGLSSSTSSQNPQQVNALRQIWQHYSERFSEEQQVAVIRLLLSRPTEPVGGTPDGYLRMWCDMVKEELPAIFDLLSADPNLTSDQKLRLWKQVEVRLDALPLSVVLQSLIATPKEVA